jgi:collagen type VII alpha
MEYGRISEKGTLTLASGAAVNEVSIDTTFAANSDSLIPTQKATKAYVASQTLSGPTGTSGYSGYSGTNGATGTSGYSGYSGYSGIGTSGYSGFSGVATLNATPADTTASGLIVSLIAGEAIAAGDLVYYKSDGRVWKAKADSNTTMPAIGLATAAQGSAGSSVTVLVNGYYQNAALYNWTVGGQASAAAGLLYVSAATGGAATQTRPATTGNQVQIVGFGATADIAFINPNSTYVEVA